MIAVVVGGAALMLANPAHSDEFRPGTHHDGSGMTPEQTVVAGSVPVLSDIQH